MVAFLEDAYLRVQNRLVDYTKRSFFSMSMSQVYSLSVVADAAFLSGCYYVSNMPTRHFLLVQKCPEALRIVQLCTNLISEFLYFPRLNRDGYLSAQAFRDMQEAREQKLCRISQTLI